MIVLKGNTKAGLNALTRSIEKKRQKSVEIVFKDDLAAGQSVVLQDEESIKIMVPPSRNSDKTKPDFSFRFVLGHELAHLHYRHDDIDGFLVDSYAGMIDDDIQLTDEEFYELLDQDADDFASMVLYRYNYLFERHEYSAEGIIDLPVVDESRRERFLALQKHADENWPENAAQIRLAQALKSVF